jgi:hypothetical protein
MKKKALSLIIAVVLLSTISVLAIDLKISSQAVSNVFVIELDEPAVFDLTIKNLGEEETFSIYSLVGINITHNSFVLKNEETKKVRIYLTPKDYLRKDSKTYTFEYKIKNSINEIQTETLAINLIDLESSFLIEPEAISPNSDKIIIDIRNNVMREFKNVEFKMNSPFFSKDEKISFNANEKKFIEIDLDKEKLKTLDAGNYILNSQITVDGRITNIESQIKFLEKEGVETIENSEGVILQRVEIVKKNTGNVKKVVKITIEKSLLEFLFTTMNVAPTETRIDGFIKTYTWEKVLIPNEEFKVVTRTNWLFPVFILIIILVGIRLIRGSIYDSLELTKKVSFVKTKGGQFALKVTVKAKAKKNLDKITIVDGIPPLVKLYEKFGVIAPDKIDLENKKLHWNLSSLNKDETRIFTYIIYSKIGIVGRFELPKARAVYEEDNELKEAISNRSFYLRD